MKEDDSWLAVVAYWYQAASQPMFRRYCGQLFGLPNEMRSTHSTACHVSFKHFAVESCGHLWPCTLTTSLRKIGRATVARDMRLLRRPRPSAPHLLNPNTRRWHRRVTSATICKESGRIWFWPRQRLVDKVKDMIQDSFNNTQPQLQSCLVASLFFPTAAMARWAGRACLFYSKKGSTLPPNH